MHVSLFYQSSAELLSDALRVAYLLTMVLVAAWPEIKAQNDYFDKSLLSKTGLWSPAFWTT